MSLAILFVSCSKDDGTTSEDPDNQTTQTEPASMTAIVDGEEWTASANFEPLAIIYNDYMTLGSMSASNYEISMTLYGTSAGNYSLNPEMGSHLYYRRSGESTYDSKLNNKNTNFGFVDIAEMNTSNKTISGTFNTEVHSFFNELSTGSKTITEGQFTNIEFQDRRDTDTEYLSTMINNKPLTTINISGYLSQGALIISGEDGSQSESITLTMSTELVAGTYNFGDGTAPMLNAQYNPLFSNVQHSANTGQLTLNTHDKDNKIIEGTFNFETPNVDGDGTFNISEGEFRVSYE